MWVQTLCQQPSEPFSARRRVWGPHCRPHRATSLGRSRVGVTEPVEPFGLVQAVRCTGAVSSPAGKLGRDEAMGAGRPGGSPFG